MTEPTTKTEVQKLNDSWFAWCFWIAVVAFFLGVLLNAWRTPVFDVSQYEPW
jgi:hypothetical protein